MLIAKGSKLDQNHHMRIIYFALTIIFGMLAGCTPPDSFHTLSGSWRLWAFEEPAEGILEQEPPHIARSIVITCKDRGKKGKYTLITVTNVLEGNYLLLEDHGMEVERMDGTLFGEPAWGSRFTEAWRGAESYEVQPGQLAIYFNGGKSRMLFLPHH